MADPVTTYTNKGDDGHLPLMEEGLSVKENLVIGAKNTANGLWLVPSTIALGAGRINHGAVVIIDTAINARLPEGKKIPIPSLEEDPYRKIGNWQPFDVKDTAVGRLTQSTAQASASAFMWPVLATAEGLSLGGEVIAYAYDMMAEAGRSNIERQSELKKKLGEPIATFNSLRNNGFGADPKERQLAYMMTQLNEQIMRMDIARPDEFASRIKLMHDTAMDLANYFETSMAHGGAEAERVKKLVASLGVEDGVNGAISQLRALAKATDPTPPKSTAPPPPPAITDNPDEPDSPPAITPAPVNAADGIARPTASAIPATATGPQKRNASLRNGKPGLSPPLTTKKVDHKPSRTVIASVTH